MTITKTEILKKNIQSQFNNFMKKILIIIALFLSTQIYSQSTQVDKLPEPMEYGQKIFYDKEGHLIVETKKNLTQEDIETVKQIILAYGATYYDAIGEADELCALLTIKNKVWACLSEDMDMFVYGCPRVIRYISLLKHTAVLYDVKDILNNLGITQKELREICILSGTDYNLDCVDNNALTNTLKHFKKYHKTKSGLGFYEWLNINRVGVIKDFGLLNKINEIFDLTINNYNSKMFDKMKTGNGRINTDDLAIILKTVGFLYMA